MPYCESRKIIVDVTGDDKMKLNLKKRTRSVYIKLIKQSGSPDYVARGVAIGFFIGFLIPMGGQMIVAFALAWLLKAKKIPALACTWITNHFTIFIIYPVQCFIGAKIIGAPMSFDSLNKIFGDFIKKHNWEAFSQLGSEIIVPFFVGGALFAVISGLISYFTAYGIIVSHRNRIEIRLNKRLATQAVWKSNLEKQRDPESSRKKSDD